MNPYLAVLVVVANAAVFTYFDASRLRDSHHIGFGPRGIAPHAWGALAFLFLPAAVPYYFAARREAVAAPERNGPPPVFVARDLNGWGYLASITFLALAVFLGFIGQFHWAALAGLGMVAGLFGGRKPEQVGAEVREFELGGAAWDMSGFRPVDEGEMDDEKELGGARIPPIAAAKAVPDLAAPGDVNVFAPLTRPASEPAPRPIVADAAPPLAMSAFEEDDDNVWDPVRADQEAQKAQERAVALPPTATAPPFAPPSAPPSDLPSPAATQPLSASVPPPSVPAAPVPAAPVPAASMPPAPQPAAPIEVEPEWVIPDLDVPDLGVPEPAPLNPALPLPVAPPQSAAAPQSAFVPPPPPVPVGPATAPEAELMPGLVDDEEPSLVDDDLAPFELAPDEDEDVLVEGLGEIEEFDEDLDRLVPLPPLVTGGARRPVPSGPPRPASPAASAAPAGLSGGMSPLGMGPASARPPASVPPTGAQPAPTRPSGVPGGDSGGQPQATRPRTSAAPTGGFVGQAAPSSSGPPAILIWLIVIGAILGAGWWIGLRDTGVPADAVAVTSTDPDTAAAVDPAPVVDRRAAVEEAMRREMNSWISTYDSAMRPIAALIEEIDFSELGRGTCLELQRQAEKANGQLRVAPDQEVELLLRPAFAAFLEAGRACANSNEVQWSVHLLQAKDHTHETQILLDERYRYVGPFELEQEEALGHQRSLDTISGRYLAGELEAPAAEDG